MAQAEFRDGLTGSRVNDKIIDVRFDEDRFHVDFLDGRSLAVPLASYQSLLHASPSDRARWSLSAGGYGIHWPTLDEDLSAEGLLRGIPSVPRGPIVA